MNCLPATRPIVTLVLLGTCVFHATSAGAHPGHEDGAAPFLLAQAGPPPRSRPAPAPTVGAATAARNSVTITVEGDYRVIRSNGWPDHAPGAFPRRGNPNTATPQSYTFRVPLKPQIAAEPSWRGGWFFAVALNGVPFEPGTGETWNNDPRSGWRYEAKTGFLDLGLDEHNAHVQPNGAYHYHALPTGLVERLGGAGKKMLLIGWAADGFPLYTATGHRDAKDAKSPLRKMKSSYRLKQGARPATPGGPGGNHDGRFTQDWEFVKGSGDLDECNGRVGVTPEFPDGIYHYCVTDEFPFIGRTWRGTPDPSFGKGEFGGPGRRPGGGGAQPGAGGFPVPPIITALDANGDSEIDAKEIETAQAALRKLDKTGEGALTLDEMLPGGGPPPGVGPQPPLPAVITALDTNGDGKLDANEITNAAAALRKLDKNGDGKLTPDEFRRRRNGPPESPAQGGGPPPRSPQP